MSSNKAIKSRISSVSSTQQIIRAMHMVAASKLQKTQEQLTAARPIFREAKRIIDNLASCEDARDNAFVNPRKVKNSAYVVITSNRGLCGGYNVNVAQQALGDMHGKSEKIVAVGLKGRDFFRRRRKNIVSVCDSMSEAADYEDIEDIVAYVTNLFTSGEVDEVFVAYTQFESALSYVPKVVKVLPIDTTPTSAGGDMLYEPSVSEYLDHAIPMYLNAFIYGAVVESSACEQAARMISMDAASNNASDIIDDLTRSFNRIRQAAITQEISEIVGGANMLS